MRALTALIAVVALVAATTVTARAYACEEGHSEMVIDVKIARDVQSRQPVDPGDSFAPGKLFCWMHVVSDDSGFTVYHVWKKDGKRVWRQPVSVKGQRWTTWSFLNVKPGAWTVVIEDEGGAELATTSFTVK